MITRALWLLVVGLIVTIGPTRAESNGVAPQLFMPDGQLKSHSVRVYISRDLALNQQPRLRLLRSHAVTKRDVDEAARLEPGIVASGQEWTESVHGQEVRRTGTLLMFDLSNLDLHYKAMVRVRPVVSWIDGGSERVVVGDHDVNLGNIVAALLWTALVVVVALSIIVAGVAWKAGKGNPLYLLTGVDGHLSLAQTQVACWTVAVGAVVLGYGMVRLEIPTIPPPVIALMGLSLATGGIGYFQDTKNLVAGGRNPYLADLVRVHPWGPNDLSLAKAQMMLWTILLLTLFISKSILDGVIWDIPWAMVSLMGFSQVGYLAPKLV